MPKISYLVSTYDSGHYLDRHLADLIQNQTDGDFEIVIVNPDSPGTDEIIAQKWERLDKRIRYIFHPEREWYGESWLRAWEAAEGEFVCNSNTDDFHMPHFTETMHKHMAVACGPMQTSKRPVAFGYGGIVVVDEHGRQKGAGQRPPFSLQQMSYECHAGPQVCWRNDPDFRKAVDWTLMRERAASYRSAFDYWLWLYFMSLGFDGYAVPEILTIYTQRPDSIENSNKWANNWETYAAIAEFYPHHFSGKLKHAPEFSDFEQLPPKDDWVARMVSGKRWKTSKHA